MVFLVACGILVGFVLGVAASVHDRNRREEKLLAELLAERRKHVKVYDWAGEPGDDALAFSQQMVDELVLMVGDLRAVALEAAAWLEGRPDATEGDAATASALRGVLEDAVPR